jgi:protein required for attachment to host cells
MPRRLLHILRRLNGGPAARAYDAPMKNWLVVANASRARVLEEGSDPGRFNHVADLVHMQSRQKGADLASDRPGSVKGIGHGLGSSQYIPRTDPREREHDRFARQVAHKLNEGVAAGQCAGLILVASNPFLGELKSHLSEQASKVLLRTVPSDFTALAEDELVQRLAGHTPQSLNNPTEES